MFLFSLQATQCNICGGTFLRKKLIFFGKSFTTDFWLGSKYGSWQYCQILWLYSYHAYFILLLKSEKPVTQRNKRLSLWSLFIDLRNQVLIPTEWIIEIDLCQILCAWFLNYYQTERVWILFLQHVLPKLVKYKWHVQSTKKVWIGPVLNCPKFAK